MRRRSRFSCGRTEFSAFQLSILVLQPLALLLFHFTFIWRRVCLRLRNPGPAPPHSSGSGFGLHHLPRKKHLALWQLNAPLRSPAGLRRRLSAVSGRRDSMRSSVKLKIQPTVLCNSLNKFTFWLKSRFKNHVLIEITFSRDVCVF